MFDQFFSVYSIADKPQVSLTIANNEKTSIVSEGSQILIECKVLANPTLVDVQIVHDSKPIYRHEHLGKLFSDISFFSKSL